MKARNHDFQAGESQTFDYASKYGMVTAIAYAGTKTTKPVSMTVVIVAPDGSSKATRVGTTGGAGTGTIKAALNAGPGNYAVHITASKDASVSFEIQDTKPPVAPQGRTGGTTRAGSR